MYAKFKDNIWVAGLAKRRYLLCYETYILCDRYKTLVKPETIKKAKTALIKEENFTTVPSNVFKQ